MLTGMTGRDDCGTNGDQRRNEADALADPASGVFLAPARPLRVDWINPVSRLLVTHWIALHGSGAGAFALAEELQRTCRGHNIRLKLASHDEFPTAKEEHRLPFYTGMVVILPSVAPAEVSAEEVANLKRVVAAYRANNPHGREALAPDRSHMARLIQVFHTDDGLTHPDLRGIYQKSCDAHLYTKDGRTDAELMAVFQPGATVRQDLVTRHRDDVWSYLERWGVHTVEEALAVLAAIDAYASALSTSGKHTLRKPLKDSELNQLQLVLHDPERRPERDQRLTQEEWNVERNKFRSNGARVVRGLFADLNRTFPEVRRPPERSGAKGSQRDVFRFYTFLKSVAVQYGSDV